MKKVMFVVGLVMLLILSVTAENAIATFQRNTPINRSFNITGRVQVFLNGYSWKFSSDEPGLKVWVLEKNIPFAGKNGWRLLGENEKMPYGFGPVRLEIGNGGCGEIEAHGFLHVAINQYSALINLCDVMILLRNSDNLVGTDFLEFLLKNERSFSLIAMEEEKIFSMEEITQRVIQQMKPGKILSGFIVQDGKGFLHKIIEINQEKIKSNPEYGEKVFAELKKMKMASHQFVVAIYSDYFEVQK